MEKFLLKKMKMKIFNFFSRIAAGIWLQKLQSFQIKIFLENLITKLYVYLKPTYLHFIFVLHTPKLSFGVCKKKIRCELSFRDQILQTHFT